MDKSIWCIEQHNKTNHMYDVYLPYEFHLRMVVQAFKDFKHLLPKEWFWRDDRSYTFNGGISWDTVIENACWGHDVIEDTRNSYNDVKQYLGQYSADIVYAVSNEKGKTRKERANDKYYQGIRDTKGAVFVKLCDRIANVQYSKMTKSRQFEMYKKENEEFMSQLGWNETYTHEYS
jgi:(p)ppGpp synthase/HD superfamily hydrolase